MKRSLITIAWLTVVWMALWEDLTWANLVGGILAGTFTTLLIPSREPAVEHGFRPLAFFHLVVHFSWKLVQATAQVAWEVITPTDRINPAVVATPLQTRSPRIATMVANMNALTPGTLSLDLIEEPLTLISHVLHFESVEASRHVVLELERLAMAAFPERGSPR